MEIKVSYEAATTQAGSVVSDEKGLLDGILEDDTILEANYNAGRDIYGNMKTMSSDYMSIMQRDAKNVLNIATKLFDVDQNMFSE